jgi:predicted RNase H-like nuclease (RuvC/YqgF family)
MQEALTQQEAATRTAEREAKQNRTQADELRNRCQAHEERCSALYAEVMDLREECRCARNELQKLKDEGISLHDRHAVRDALANTFRGCVYMLYYAGTLALTH